MVAVEATQGIITIRDNRLPPAMKKGGSRSSFDLSCLRVPNIHLGPLESRTNLAYTHRTQFMPDANRVVQSLAQHSGTKESTRKAIACAICINDLV